MASDVCNIKKECSKDWGRQAKNACDFLNKLFEPVHKISNNVVCATSKASDQPGHTRSLIRAFPSCLSIL